MLPDPLESVACAADAIGPIGQPVAGDLPAGARLDGRHWFEAAAVARPAGRWILRCRRRKRSVLPCPCGGGVSFCPRLNLTNLRRFPVPAIPGRRWIPPRFQRIRVPARRPIRRAKVAVRKLVPGKKRFPLQVRLQPGQRPPSLPPISPGRISSDGDWKHGERVVSFQPGFLTMENFLHS